MNRSRLARIARALALAAATVLVLGLATSLVLRLYGRQRLAQARTAFEREGFSLVLGAYELPPVPRAENAAAWLEAGAAAVVLSRDDDERLLQAPAAGTGLDGADQSGARVRSLLEGNRSALDMLHRAASLERSSFGIPYREGAYSRIPDLLALRRAASLLRAEGRLALQDRDGEAAFRSAAALARLADALAAEPAVVTQLMAEVVDAQLVDLGWETALAPGLIQHDAGTLTGAQGPFGPRPRLAQLRTALGGEAAVLATWLAHGRPAPTDDPAAAARAQRQRTLFDLTGLLSLTQASVLDAARRQSAFLTAPLDVLLNDDPAPPSSPLQIHRWMAEPLTRAARRAVLRTRLTLARRQLVRAALVLRSTSAASGRYPTNPPRDAGLDEPNALTAVPLVYLAAPDGSALVEVPGLPNDGLGDGYPPVRLVLPAVR